MDEIRRALQYRNKAEEMLVIAEGFRSEDTKNFLKSVADDYRSIAESLERTAERVSPNAV